MFDYKIYEENLKSEILGRSFKFLNKTQSTNDEAKKYPAASHGHTILTYNQTKGRGRRNNRGRRGRRSRPYCWNRYSRLRKVGR